jgi:hypothetical protein
MAASIRASSRPVSGPAAKARLGFDRWPYPQRFDSEIRTPEGQSYLVRPIKPEHEPALHRFADEVDTQVRPASAVI